MNNIDKRVEEILAKMSLHEKIGQLNQPQTPLPEQTEKLKEMVRRGEISSILMAVGATADRSSPPRQAVFPTRSHRCPTHSSGVTLPCSPSVRAGW